MQQHLLAAVSHNQYLRPIFRAQWQEKQRQPFAGAKMPHTTGCFKAAAVVACML